MNASTRLTAAALSLSSLFAMSTAAMAQPITAVIKLKERVSIEQLAKNVKEEASARLGIYYTSEEIRDLSAPSTQAYEGLLSSLRAEGFAITHESPTHLWLSVQADSSLFEKTFGAKIEYVGANLRHNTAAIQIPSRLSLIESVSGLDNLRKAHPMYVRSAMKALDDGHGGIAQSTIKTAYGFDGIYQAGWTGKGQHIAIATYDGFMIDDVNSFYTSSAISPAPVVDQVQFNGAPTYSEGSAMETQLDAEFSGMMAPGSAIHVFASAENSDAGELAMFTAIMDDGRASVVNYSWGSCETQVTPQHAQDMEKVLARAVAQGVNVMVASGDNGSDTCQDGSNAPSWPSADDNVVSVGGTTFAQNGTQIAETGWSGSGGGISTLWGLPTWQQSLGAPYLKRSIPDVAFNADPNSGEAIYAHNGGVAQWIVIGGTSMAAPQWSGFMALVGEARAAKSEKTLGYLNPIIYGLTAAEKATMFNDVTSGSNGAYSCGPGWDAVTGWGSMQAENLLTRLVAN